MTRSRNINKIATMMIPTLRIRNLLKSSRLIMLLLIIIKMDISKYNNSKYTKFNTTMMLLT